MSMRLPSSRVALASGLALALAACGGSDDTGSNGNGTGPDAAGEPEGENYTYVINELRIPTSASEANQLGLDLDGDGETNNALGILLSALGNVVGDIDLQATLNAQFDDGTIIVLAELKATSLADASNAAMWVYLGDNPSTEPCVAEDDCGYHFDGSTSFDLAANSPTDARVDGTITGGSFSGGPGTVSLQLALVDDIPPLNIDLVGARVEIESVSETGLASGRLGGGITLAQIEDELIPAIAAGLTALLEAECEGAGEEPQPCGCPEDSAAEIVQTTFDTDDSCDVSAEELLENNTVAALIQADVDLLDENGNFNPTPNSDNPDSMSLGVGFTAVGAEFSSPNQ
jgi:hypothetical protein